jgi:ketosteroid isomerase-like protein
MDMQAQSRQTAAITARFNDAFLTHDPSLLEGLIADDCVIENTTPAPDGARHVGGETCLKLWQGIATQAGTRFDVEEVVAMGERGIIRWRYHFGEAQSVRGVNLMRVRDGKIVEAMGYVKGG